MLNNKVSIAHAKSKKILILNLKGGVGKSTFTVNLASKLCRTGQVVEIIDTDKQVSSHAWAKNIDEIGTQQLNVSFRGYSDIASSVKVDKESQYVIIDSPGNFDDAHIKKYLMLADYVIIPIQPSPVDLHATLPFIEKIMVNLRLIKREVKVGFVINRCTDQNPQVQTIQRLLSHFQQYKTLGLMSDSHLYQEPFQKQTLSNITLDSELWQRVMRWLGLSSENNEIARFPVDTSTYADSVTPSLAKKRASNVSLLPISRKWT
jgi:chromosome partitioning protein